MRPPKATATSHARTVPPVVIVANAVNAATARTVVPATTVANALKVLNAPRCARTNGLTPIPKPAATPAPTTALKDGVKAVAVVDAVAVDAVTTATDARKTATALHLLMPNRRNLALPKWKARLRKRRNNPPTSKAEHLRKPATVAMVRDVKNAPATVMAVNAARAENVPSAVSARMPPRSAQKTTCKHPRPPRKLLSLLPLHPRQWHRLLRLWQQQCQRPAACPR